MDLTRFRLKKSFLSAPLLNSSLVLGLLCQIFFIAFSLFDWQRGIPFKSLFSASYEDVFGAHEYYRLLTAVFAHSNWDHALGNSIFFIPFAALLTNYFGLKLFPFLSLLVGALINLVVILVYPPQVSVLGVSGVIYFMVAFWLVLYIGIERGLSLRQKILRSLGLALIEFMPEKFDANVSYLSHGVGFILVLLIGYCYFQIFKKELRSYEVWEPIEPDEPIGETFEEWEQISDAELKST